MRRVFVFGLFAVHFECCSVLFDSQAIGPTAAPLLPATLLLLSLASRGPAAFALLAHLRAAVPWGALQPGCRTPPRSLASAGFRLPKNTTYEQWQPAQQKPTIPVRFHRTRVLKNFRKSFEYSSHCRMCTWRCLSTRPVTDALGCCARISGGCSNKTINVIYSGRTRRRGTTGSKIDFAHVPMGRGAVALISWFGVVVKNIDDGQPQKSRPEPHDIVSLRKTSNTEVIVTISAGVRRRAFVVTALGVVRPRESAMW